jgi:hypothetical protein
MAHTKTGGTRRVSPVSQKAKCIVGCDRLNWRHADDRLFLCHGNNRNPLLTVEPDSEYTGMYRIRVPDGGLSDMANLTRAKDAAIALALRILNSGVRRWNRLRTLMIEKGHFSEEQATKATNDPSPDSKEPIASWLRKELKELREKEKIVSAAPVLNGKTLSRSVIADLAMTMVELCASQPGENLICLLQELLGVDRHRASQADKPIEAFQKAAQFDAQLAIQGKRIGVRPLAKIVSVDISTISRWRRNPDYNEAVATFESIFSKALADNPDFFNSLSEKIAI